MPTLPSAMLLGLGLIWLTLLVQAYIPAVPTNDSAAVQAAVNESDTSLLKIQWFPNATFTQTISHQIVGSSSTGINKGALVHFTEQNDSNQTTTTPWIAFVSRDTNGSSFSLNEDVFTLARDQGAVAALLYSEWSEACIINPDYANPGTFDHTIDIFSTKSLVTARTIENAFINVNQSLYGNFNAATLNNTFDDINQGIQTGQVSPGYLIATLTAATNVSVPETGAQPGSSSVHSSAGKRSSIDLAIIALFITLFQILLIVE